MTKRTFPELLERATRDLDDARAALPHDLEAQQEDIAQKERRVRWLKVCVGINRAVAIGREGGSEDDAAREVLEPLRLALFSD
jgi:hypothetical protein